MTTVPVGCVRLYYPIDSFVGSEREALADVLSTIAADIRKKTLEPDTWMVTIRIETSLTPIGDSRVHPDAVDDRAGTAE